MAEVNRQRYRADIQGLRAVAVLLVVFYHAALPVIPGGYIGVDVFFVISGFLITNHLVNSLDSSGRISFADFYARRARRLLPAAFVVLILSLVAAYIWLAPLQLRSTFQDAAATALYLPNVLFAYHGTDYLAESTPSLFQHYWSLGVEEQFYLVWPAFLVVAYRLTGRVIKRLFWAVAVVAVGSFAASVVVLPIAQPLAFFLLPTRAWELAIGGLLAFAPMFPRVVPSARVAAVGGWAALASLLVFAVAFTDATPFPGVNAAGPVLATAAVIYFGAHAGARGPAAILACRPAVFIGSISYSLYLVHWPLLIIPAQAGGLERTLPIWVSLSLGVVAIPLAWLLHRFVEVPGQSWRPVARRRPHVALLAAAVASFSVVLLAMGGVAAVGRETLSTNRTAPSMAVSDPPVFTDFVPKNMRPTLRGAASDNPAIYSNGCHLDERTTHPSSCEYGTNAAAPLVELFGDSHAAQWFPPLAELATSGQILLRVDTKSSCPSVTLAKENDGTPYTACDAWRQAVLERLSADPPDLVVLGNFARSTGFSAEPGHPDRWAEGLRKTLAALPPSSAQLVLADTPEMGGSPAACLSAHLDSAAECGKPRPEAISTAIETAERRVADQQGAHYVSMNDFICSADRCDPVVGNVLVYRDANHLTATFSAALASQLYTELETALQGRL